MYYFTIIVHKKIVILYLSLNFSIFDKFAKKKKNYIIKYGIFFFYNNKQYIRFILNLNIFKI